MMVTIYICALFTKYSLGIPCLLVHLRPYLLLYVGKAEICIAREIDTFFGVATPTQCLIRREWPIVGFCTKLVVAYSGL